VEKGAAFGAAGTREKKKMPEEIEAEAALTVQKETTRVMKSALDTIAAGFDTRFQQLTTKRLVSCWTLKDS